MTDLVQWGRFVLATIFLVAGVSKLGDRRRFAEAVRGYQLVPSRVAVLIARLLPPLEVTVALLLLGGVWTAGVAALVGSLLLTFTVAITVNLTRRRPIHCGCFGSIVEREVTWWTVIRNVGLVAVAMLVTMDGGQGNTAVAPMLVAGSLTVAANLLVSASLSIVGSAHRIRTTIE